MLDECFSFVQPSQVVLVGARDLDPEEERFIAEHNISVIPPTSIGALADDLDAKDASKIYVHLDLDVLDPSSFPHQLLPIPGGISTETFLTELKLLHNQFEIVGASIVEYVPKDNSGLAFIKEIVDVLNI